MRQNREKLAKTQYLRKYTSDLKKNTHDAHFYANSSYRRVSAILKKKIVIFLYNETKEKAIKHSKPNNFETMKTRMIKFDTAPLFMLSYHLIKFETISWKNIFLRNTEYVTLETDLKFIDLFELSEIRNLIDNKV